MTRLPQLVVVASFWAVVAVSAFWITSMSPYDILSTTSVPPCTYGEQTVIPPRFDPWTGVRLGYTYVCDEGTGKPLVTQTGASGSWALPLPLGFVVGAVAMTAVLWLYGRRPKTFVGGA